MTILWCFGGTTISGNTHINWWSWHGMQSLVMLSPYVWDARSCVGYYCFLGVETPNLTVQSLWDSGGRWGTLDTGLDRLRSDCFLFVMNWFFISCPFAWRLILRFQAEPATGSDPVPQVSTKNTEPCLKATCKTILQSLGMTEARLQLGLVFWGSQCHTSQVARDFPCRTSTCSANETQWKIWQRITRVEAKVSKNST